MSLTHLCQILDVSRSGFYAWQRRPASTHARRDQQLRVLIRASHEASRGTYGSPRLHRDLQAQGHRVSRKPRDPAETGGGPDGACAEAVQAHDHE